MLNATDKQNIPFLPDGIKALNREKEKEAGGRLCKINISGKDFFECYSLLNDRIIKKRKPPEGHSVLPESVLNKASDLNRMVSKCFSTLCSEYYERCMMLDELIASAIPENEKFMKIINSGPIYKTDCCRFVTSYKNKFKNYSMTENTVLHDLRTLVENSAYPPGDIYIKRTPMDKDAQRVIMDVVSRMHYVVSEGVKATEALLALRNKFCIIECNIAYQIAYYEAVLLIIGEKKFNDIFDRSTELPFNVSSDHKIKLALDRFISWRVTPRNEDKQKQHLPSPIVHEGHVYYFYNHFEYSTKHPAGESQGFNVMLVNIIDECPYFTGFGFPGEGLNAQGIACKLVDSFNRSAEDDFQKLYHLSFSAEKGAERLKEKTITVKDFYDSEGGFFFGKVMYLDLSKIQSIFFLPDGMRDLNIEKEKEARGKKRKIPITEIGSLNDNSSRKCRKKIGMGKTQERKIGYPVFPEFSIKRTPNDVNIMVSKCFATLCKEYYERCIQLDELIASALQEDDSFMKILNSGPIYRKDLCRFLTGYCNKFKSYYRVENAVLSFLKQGYPPMDINTERQLMDRVSVNTYVVAQGVKATEALSALRNMFCIIDGAMACQIAYYEVILLIMGEKSFNEKFDKSTGSPLMVSPDHSAVLALDLFTSERKLPKNEDKKKQHLPPLTVKEGHAYYFSNHKDYRAKHPIGSIAGFNVMLVKIIDECPYFTAFGFPGEGLKAQDIICKLVDAFNCSTEDDVKKLYGLPDSITEKADGLKDKTITKKELCANNGGWASVGNGIYLNVCKIKSDLLTRVVNA